MATDHKMTASEAGRLGGLKVLKERGREFYSQIGSRQGKENNPGNFANRTGRKTKNPPSKNK